jgi:uncharacterized protein (TIGR00369 family)
VKILPRYRRCFVCGRDNAAGLNVTFHRSGSIVTANFSGDNRHVGFPQQLHGGIISSLLDEAMGWAAVSAAAKMVQTWEITIRFHRALPPERSVRVEAWVEEKKSRYVLAAGRILDEQGNIYARGSGKYFRLSDAQEKEILRELYVEGEEGRPVTPEDY